jgi:hypothetical protein
MSHHLLAILGCFILAVPQLSEAAEYSIQSPLSGARVRPGQQLEVVVSGPPAKNVFVFAGAGSLVESYVISPPYRYVFSVPSNKRAGVYRIDAHVQKFDGAVESIGIDVVVEPDAAGSQLLVKPDDIRFTFLGQTISVGVSVTSAGSTSSVLSSPSLTSQSSNGQIVDASISKTALVAVGVGSAVISYQYQGIQAQLLADVELSPLAGDLNADGRIDQLDIGIVQSRVGLPKVVPNDSRDINQDGKIDALDLRVLTSMCSKPRCAT